MVNTEIRLLIFFAAKDREALYSQQKQDWELTMLYKKDLHEQDNHDGMITHLEPDILECEVKKALEHHYEQS